MRTIDGLIEKYKDRKINILTAPTHERYQSGFKDINATFHMVQFSNFKPWNNQYAPLPKNHILWPKGYFPEGIRFDLVLSQNKFGQFQFFYPIARSRNIPLISLEHTLPMPEWSDVNIKELSQLRGDINIFISNYSRQKWGFDDGIVVNHMVDTDLFKPSQNRKNKVLSVVNDYVNRDYCCGYSIYRQLVDGNFTLIGDTPGLSEPAKSIEELALQYSSHKIFLNTSTVSPLPTALLEAMSSGCAVVSTNNCMIPEVIQHGVNGFMSNDINELRGYIDLLIQDDDLAYKMGIAARKTILEKFSKESFNKNWSYIIERVSR